MFKGMFEGSFKEGHTSEPIALPQYDHAPEAFHALLEFVHIGKAHIQPGHGKDAVQQILDLYEMANYFQINELQTQCQTTIENVKPSKQTTTVLFQFGTKHGLTQLASSHTEYIKNNADEVFADPK